MRFLAERLAESRRRAGLKQVELAVALGGRYGASMISNVETGRSALLLDGARKAAKTLDVSIDYLVGLTDDQEGWLQERFLRHPGNAEVVRQDLLRERSIDVSLRTVERAVAPFRRLLTPEVKGDDCLSG